MCVCVCERLEDNSQEPVLSFHHTESRDCTLVVRVGAKDLDPVSHITGIPSLPPHREAVFCLAPGPGQGCSDCMLGESRHILLG